MWGRIFCGRKKTFLQERRFHHANTNSKTTPDSLSPCAETALLRCARGWSRELLAGGIGRCGGR